MERVVSEEVVKAAMESAIRNGGAAGMDGMTVSEFPGFWEQHGPSICRKLLSGSYRPSPVRRVAIPKPDGGERLLGIPTVLDRVIQGAILLVLQPLVDPTFSDASYGFRPGRSAHDAVRATRGFVNAGHDWVVDIDLEKFFDRVNHDVLMHRVSLRVEDKRLLCLIRRYLTAGVMVEGVCVATEEGTPQGGPLSPLLANVLLDDLDKELERRGHKFARYADDCNVYVRSEAAGRRVFESVSRFLEEVLRLRVNARKSAVDRPWNRKFLGFSFLRTGRGARLRVAEGSLARFRDRVRELTPRTRGESLERVIGSINRYATGWFAYFRVAEVDKAFVVLDKWVRRRLRSLIWQQWKTPANRLRRLRAAGVPAELAVAAAKSRKGAWRLSAVSALHRALDNAYFDRAGLFSLHASWAQHRASTAS